MQFSTDYDEVISWYGKSEGVLVSWDNSLEEEQVLSSEKIGNTVPVQHKRDGLGILFYLFLSLFFWVVESYWYKCIASQDKG